MTPVATPVAAAVAVTGSACLLLVAGGALKVVRPADTARALAALRLPGASRLAVRVGAGVEVLAGVGALVVGGRVLAGLIAVAYLGFAGVVVLALRRRLPLRSCGCFGVVESPPVALHAVLDLVAAGAAGAVALGPAPSLASVLGSQPLGGAPLAALVVVVAYLAYLALTTLPVRPVPG